MRRAFAKSSYAGWRLKSRLEAYGHKARLRGLESESATADFAAARAAFRRGFNRRHALLCKSPGNMRGVDADSRSGEPSINSRRFLLNGLPATKSAFGLGPSRRQQSRGEARLARRLHASHPLDISRGWDAWGMRGKHRLIIRAAGRLAGDELGRGAGYAPCPSSRAATVAS
jgi:hypothetical protein